MSITWLNFKVIRKFRWPAKNLPIGRKKWLQAIEIKVTYFRDQAKHNAYESFPFLFKQNQKITWSQKLTMIRFEVFFCLSRGKDKDVGFSYGVTVSF